MLEIQMKIEVTTGRGVMSFQSMSEMFEFTKTYARVYRRLPKRIMIDNKVIDTPGRMIMCEMVYLVETISGYTYCLNRFEYENFVESVSRGDRKAPASVLKLTDAGPGSMVPWTSMFDEDVEDYVRRILDNDKFSSCHSAIAQDSNTLIRLRRAYRGSSRVSPVGHTYCRFRNYGNGRS